jgi:hypothetical protein
MDHAAVGDQERQAMRDHPQAMRREVMIGMRSLGDATFSRDLVDLVLSVGEFAVDGDAQGGFRVQLRSAGRSYPYYVVPRGGRLLVLVDQPQAEALAREAWRLFDEGDAERGWRWLDWVRDSMPETQPRDPLGGSPSLRLWRPQSERTASEGRVAAASLFVSAHHLPQGIQVLGAWRDALKDDAARRDVDRALLALYVRAHRPEDTLRTLEGLDAGFPDSERAWSIRVDALLDLGRVPLVRQLLEERLRADPADALALRTQASVAGRSGQYEEAERARGWPAWDAASPSTSTTGPGTPCCAGWWTTRPRSGRARGRRRDRGASPACIRSPPSTPRRGA